MEQMELDLGGATINNNEIKRTLRLGSFFVEGKYRIYDFFSSCEVASEQADFLKNEYGTGGCTGNCNGGVAIAYDTKGIKLTKEDAELLVSWSMAAALVRGMIYDGTYLSHQEYIEYLAWKEVKDYDEERDTECDKPIL